MLNVNHLTGFGVSETGVTSYRYLRLYVSTTSGPNYLGIDEINWVAVGVDYPTQTMTSNVAPSPLVASASSEAAAANAAWKAMDNSTSSYWAPTANLIPAWHTIDLGLGNGILPTSIGITPVESASYLPTAFTCYGSNTGSFAGEEITLGTFSPGATGWTAHTSRTFTF